MCADGDGASGMSSEGKETGNGTLDCTECGLVLFATCGDDSTTVVAGEGVSTVVELVVGEYL